MIATASDSIRDILDKAVDGERLSAEEGIRLLESNDLSAIGAAADKVSRRMHPEPYRTYNVDRNINYTNVCTAVCHFCAFYRGPKSDEGYVLPREELLKKVEETVALGGNQILMQGGLHPKYKLDWYEELLSDIKTAFPEVNVHGFSPPELHHFTKVNNLPIEEVLARLKAAGLGSIPGGGAEILVDRVRNELTRGKVMTDDWLNVMRVWHQLGGISTSTMMFGHVETLAERIEHLQRLRDLQDETNGFTAFICWTFQPDNTDMSRIPPSGSFEYLKTQAVSRLFLDNIPNIQSSWVTQGLQDRPTGYAVRRERHGQSDDRRKRRRRSRHGALLVAAANPRGDRRTWISTAATRCVLRSGFTGTRKEGNRRQRQSRPQGFGRADVLVTLPPLVSLPAPPHFNAGPESTLSFRD